MYLKNPEELDATKHEGSLFFLHLPGVTTTKKIYRPPPRHREGLCNSYKRGFLVFIYFNDFRINTATPAHNSIGRRDAELCGVFESSFGDARGETADSKRSASPLRSLRDLEDTSCLMTWLSGLEPKLRWPAPTNGIISGSMVSAINFFFRWMPYSKRFFVIRGLGFGAIPKVSASLSVSRSEDSNAGWMAISPVLLSACGRTRRRPGRLPWAPRAGRDRSCPGSRRGS